MFELGLSRDLLIHFILPISCSSWLKFDIQFKLTELDSIKMILIDMILN